MKTQRPYESVAAVIALSLWVVIVSVEVVMGGRWAWSLSYILLSTPMTVLTTFLLCRFWCARKKSASYGTLLGVPFGSSLFAYLFLHFYSDGLHAFHFWLQADGSGLRSFSDDLPLIWGVSVLPAIAIVVYYQKRSKTGEPDVA